MDRRLCKYRFYLVSQKDKRERLQRTGYKCGVIGCGLFSGTITEYP
jgi:hypothetical protein